MAVAGAGAVLAACILTLLAPLPAHAASGGGRCAGESFSANRAYAACNDLPRLGASVHWTYDRASGDLSVAFVAAPAAPGGWVAWALNPSGDGMAGAQALVAGPFSSDGGAGTSWAVRTYNISGYALGEPGPIAFPASDLAAELGADGRVRVFGRLGLGAAGYGGGVLNQVWQVGAAVSSGGVPAPHAMGADNLAAKTKLDLLRATTAAAGVDSATRKRNVSALLGLALSLTGGRRPTKPLVCFSSSVTVITFALVFWRGAGAGAEYYKDPWSPERRELGRPAAHGRHLRQVPQDVPGGRPRVVLPPRHLPADRLRRGRLRLGHRHPTRQGVQGRHLHRSPQHRHRSLRSRHPSSRYKFLHFRQKKAGDLSDSDE